MAEETMPWLNESFMEEVLRKSEGDNSIRVIDIFIKPATNKGDNYSSEMFRVTVEYSRRNGDQEITEKKPIILKVAPIMLKDLIMKGGVFDTEISMMSDTLDKMNKLLRPENRLSAKCLYTQKKEPALLALEDLALLGFRMADRQAGLDLTHCLLAMRGLARFHASSIAVCEQDPSRKEKYHLGMFNEKYPPEMRTFFVVAITNIANQVAKWPELGARYSEKLSRLASKIYQVGIDAYKLDKDEFNVINHGDFSVMNMMFKYNEKGEPVDHICVDFQMTFYGSPAIDLLYFLNNSPSVEVMENNEDLLLEQYLDILTTTMKELGCKKRPPTMEELKNMMKRRAKYGMISSLTVYPIILCDREDVTDMNEIFTSGSNEIPAFKGKLFREVMTKRLPHYDQLVGDTDGCAHRTCVPPKSARTTRKNFMLVMVSGYSMEIHNRNSGSTTFCNNSSS